MNATITVVLTADSAEDAQRALNRMLEEERQKGTISSFSFEIDSPAGSITERCVISEGKVVA